MDMLSDLDELHGILLSMLKDIDDLCRKHEIKYFMILGSLLGTIRHDGFIPWDDDVDICLFRKDYEKFLSIAKTELDPEKYFVQKDYEGHWERTFSKIRLNGTTFIEKTVFDKTIHQGCFIDILPLDNLSSSKVVREMQWSSYKIISNKHSDIFNEKRSFNRFVKHIICCCFPDKILLDLVKLEKKESSNKVHLFLGAGITKTKNELYREDFEKTIDHQFEDMIVSIPQGWNRILQTEYGDYMQIPSIEDRMAHIHARYYNFHKDYKDYLNELGEEEK